MVHILELAVFVGLLYVVRNKHTLGFMLVKLFCGAVIIIQLLKILEVLAWDL